MLQAASGATDSRSQQLHAMLSPLLRYREPLLQQNQRLTQRRRQRRLWLLAHPHSTVVRVLTGAATAAQQHSRR